MRHWRAPRSSRYSTQDDSGGPDAPARRSRGGAARRSAVADRVRERPEGDVADLLRSGTPTMANRSNGNISSPPSTAASATRSTAMRATSLGRSRAKRPFCRRRDRVVPSRPSAKAAMTNHTRRVSAAVNSPRCRSSADDDVAGGHVHRDGDGDVEGDPLHARRAGARGWPRGRCGRCGPARGARRRPPPCRTG